MGQTRFATGRQLDLICLGRLGVDLYAQQVGARLEDVSSFAKYLGGSSANIAFGTARLGLRSAMLSRVGDDHMGRFLVESLAREGCDVSAIKRDPERLTAMVLLGLKDRETFPWCSTAKIAPTWLCAPRTSTNSRSRRARRC
ncbi:5-dehydro-2-deoxygluconokinase IolC [Pseudomonas savastanoi pv. glycinea]|uniref:5-dehydro-2-deoxygluconokinase IolC n=1 Tax=Pseudomonas savastanoi pv. glycinea TaxID=318 RepID=A0A3M3FD20_PSESG|nr:5-dehydro-2-deoxygluconokinase [Pseudomonas savastanoi pv. phaseolicola]RMM59813.1 5-dehydro-2-deoxygluconokinase IolC [Pseudomonas savastanoi pv. glycinea]RMQ67962.1 5-dehydro-2-deoxygluconokinase IolC [Pseudomonas savastanoi pv. glycinea]RMV57810.1 5-dehydro-2-deoxygluconokinase IolC [Pseudomonas savastanoi pv. glycinea]